MSGRERRRERGRAGSGLALILSGHVPGLLLYESPADYVMLQLAHLRLHCIPRVQVNYLRSIFF